MNQIVDIDRPERVEGVVTHAATGITFAEVAEKKYSGQHRTPPAKPADPSVGIVMRKSASSGTIPRQVKAEPTEGYPPGARVLAGCFGLLSGVGEFVQAGHRQQENVIVRAALDSLSDGLASLSEQVESVFRAEYPDLPRLR